MPACLSVFLSVFLLSVFWLFTCRGKGKKKKKKKKKKSNKQTNKFPTTEMSMHGVWQLAVVSSFSRAIPIRSLTELSSHPMKPNLCSSTSFDFVSVHWHACVRAERSIGICVLLYVVVDSDKP